MPAGRLVSPVVNQPGPLSKHPLVAVVTPVYNGAAHLAECVESVLSQTYENWEYVIVDNCSNDQTEEIAARYASRDDRIRVITNDRFLDLIENWNHALSQISPESAYCKVVHADDAMTRDCLERMVGVARKHPSVAIVSAYRLNGDEVDLDGVIPWGTEVVPGREICRTTLLGGGYVFGSPSSLLVRSDLIRAKDRFYNEENLHADLEACFDLLRTGDLGFVHQVLTHTRRHAGSQTSGAASLSTHMSGWLRALTTYGPLYLGDYEYQRRLALALRRYGWFLTKSAARGRFRDDRFRTHHLATLRMLRQSVGWAEAVRGLAPGLPGTSGP
jgi:glycosyltransferase involved in cell wall biosynthesis